MDIFKNVILNYTNKLCPQKYKSKYSHSYYLDFMIFVLRDFTSWYSLGRILNILKKNKQHHFKSIYNVFLKWSNLGIFKMAYDEILLHNCKYNFNSTVDLFIDTTNINNKNGFEDVDYGINKKKKISKISLISDKFKNVYSISIHNGKTHDIKTVDDSINKMIKFKHKRINLIGDKGYINKDIKNNLKNKKINLIYPKRKNQKIKTNEYEKKKLSKRYIIEHVNQKIKYFDRISLRKDILNKTFLSNIYLALILIYIK